MIHDELVIVIDECGDSEMIVDDAWLDTLAEGNTATRRASHVEPLGLLARVAFHALRRAFGDEGRAAAFTRRWPCLWRVNMKPSDGPVFGAYANRDEAIDAEVEWLNDKLWRDGSL